jgi:hypothetical protein
MVPHAAKPQTHPPAQAARAAEAQAQPFFVVGAQRSGTTMLRLMLNQHPHLCVPFESGFIPVFERRLGQYGDLRDPRNAARLVRDIAAYPKVSKGELLADPEAVLGQPITGYPDLVRAIFTVYAERKGKARWGDKTPAYVTELDVLWRLFPGCRILHLVRDGRDVALSVRRLSWGSRNLPHIAADWAGKVVLAHKIGGVLGDHYLALRYEDLVRDPEAALRVVCRFLGEPYDPAMLRYERTAKQEMPADSLRWHRSSVRRPDPARAAEWRHAMSRADRIIFEQIAGEALELFGYPREHLSSTWVSRLKNLYYGAVRRW